jgi:hypothetical protein
MFRWKLSLPTFGFGAAAASLGAIVHSVVQDGSASPSQLGFAGALCMTIVGLFVQIHGAWKAAGGKFDGHVTPTESKAVIKAAAETLKVSPALKQVVEDFAPQAADLANGLIAWMTKTFTDSKPPQQSQPDKVALLMNAQQAIAWELANDTEGSAAIAKALERLHQLWNPNNVAAAATSTAATN